MEEKEPIRVKLSTVLLIIAVVVIIATAVVIGILYKQNISKNNNTPNTENVMIGENEISNVEDVEKNDIDEQDNKENDDFSDSNTTTIITNENKSTKQNSSNNNISKDSTQNTSKDTTQMTPNVSKNTATNKILGKWKAEKVVDSDGNDLGLSAVWGTGITYSNEMEFKENGILSYAIGITASSDDGTYTINGNTIKYGLPTDVKGEMNWSTLTYIPEEDVLKEEIDVVGEKAIVTYIRAD